MSLSNSSITPFDLPEDIKSEIISYVDDKDVIRINGLDISSSRLVNDIQLYDQSFNLLSILCKKRDKYNKDKQYKSSKWYSLYLILLSLNKWLMYNCEVDFHITNEHQVSFEIQIPRDKTYEELSEKISSAIHKGMADTNRVMYSMNTLYNEIYLSIKFESAEEVSDVFDLLRDMDEHYRPWMKHATRNDTKYTSFTIDYCVGIFGS